MLIRKFHTKFLPFFSQINYFGWFIIYFMFCNNTSCLQLNLYGISNVLSFKIRFLVHNLAIFPPFWIAVVNFTSRSITLRLRISHFVFCHYPETSGGIRNGHNNLSPPQSRKVELGMRKWQRLKRQITHRSGFRLLDVGISASHL